MAREDVTHEMRRRAKAVNFGIVYGISAFSLSQDLGVTVAEAREYMDGYFAAIEIATSTASYNIEGKYDNLTFRYYSDCDCSLQVLGDNDAVLADISVKGGQVAQSVTVPLFKTSQLTFKTENVWGDGQRVYH